MNGWMDGEESRREREREGRKEKTDEWVDRRKCVEMP